MKIGPIKINFAKAKKADTSATVNTGKVDEFIGVTSKTFSNYKTVSGDQAITYDLVEGLYKRTIMNKVINKIAGDSARLEYNVTYTKPDGSEDEASKKIGDEIDKLITHKTMWTLFRDLPLYGDTFLYKNLESYDSGTGITLNFSQIYPVNPRYIEPKMDGTQFVGWKYTGSDTGQEIDLTFEEVVHIANNPLTGQLFGISMFEPVLQVLNLVLNSQMNTAILLDRFAIPIIQWLVESTNEKQYTPPETIKDLLKQIQDMRLGSDIGTDSKVKHEVVGAGDKAIDFAPILDKLDQHMFITTGVPGQILGAPADNLSAIVRQMQTYYENIKDTQRALANSLIEDVYKPELIAQGIEPLPKIEFTFQKPLLEHESRIVTWVLPMYEAGLISDEVALAAMGLTGKAVMPLEEMMKLKQKYGQKAEENKEVTTPTVK